MIFCFRELFFSLTPFRGKIIDLGLKFYTTIINREGNQREAIKTLRDCR